MRDETSRGELGSRSCVRCEHPWKARLRAGLFAFALSGCSDPHFLDPDAGLVAQEVDPTLLAESLLGVYVVRTDSFSEDKLQITHGREIALVEITRKGKQVELSARVCAWAADNGWGSLELADPASFPPRQQQVLFEQGRWRTLPVPMPVGYEPLPPDACEGAEGRRVPKQYGQDWLAETCICPPSPDVFPGLEDCRVTDPDGDGAPGITYNAKAIDFPAKVHFVRELSFGYVNGTVSPTGHHTAREEQSEQMRQLSCNFASCLLVGQSSLPCRAEFNRVQFAPLAARSTAEGGAWTCEEALEVADDVLAYAAISPARCQP